MLVFLLALLALFPMAAPPTTYAIGGAVTVNSTSDSADDSNNSTCTLREALQVISEVSSGLNLPKRGCNGVQADINTITFSVSGTISVSSSLPDITSNISITGPITINGQNNPDSPIFRVSSADAIFNLTNLTITKGEPAIVGTSAEAIINIAGSSFVDNSRDAIGGAIYTSGALNIAGSNFTDNRSIGFTNGGGGEGGAIYAIGSKPLNIAGSVFNGNTAKNSGGAIYTSTPGTIVDTIFNGNIAEGRDSDGDGDHDQFDDSFSMGGGAIFAWTNGNMEPLTIVRSVFNGNIAAPYGNAGALYVNADKQLEIRDSSFNGNLSGSASNDRLGGAILTAGAAITMTGVTLLNNAVTGDGGALAIDRDTRARIANVTIVANAATNRGGGVFSFNTQQNGSSNIRPDLQLLNTTIALNVSLDGGGIFGQAPTSSHPEPHQLGNTILSGNLPDNCGGGSFTNLGNNLDSSSSCGLSGNGNLQNVDPQLEAPAFNGGPLADLLTMKLAASSPALDSGNPQICADPPVDGEDQRSEPRTGDGNGDGVGGCDIGAYEGGVVKAGYGSTPVQPGPIELGNIQLGQSGQTNFTIFNTGNKPLTLSAAITGAQADQFSIVTFPPQVNSSETATIRCNPTGNTGLRTATLVINTNDSDKATVTYELRCNGTPEPVAGFGSIPPAPGPISLGNSVIGTPKLGSISILSLGTAALVINSATLSGPNASEFAVGAVGSPPFTLSVSCTPAATGIRTAFLTMTSNDPVKPSVVFNLSCTGIAPPDPLLAENGINDYTGGGMNGPYGLAMSPDGRSVYAAGFVSDSITTFTRNPNSGALTYQSTNTDLGGNLDGAIRVVVSPSGRYVYVAAASADRVLAYERGSTGLLSLLDSVTEGEQYGCFPAPCTGPVRGLDSAYGMAISSDERYLYVAGYSNTGAGADDNRTIVTFSIGSDGGLQNLFNDPTVRAITSHSSLDGTYDLVLSPDGGSLYAINYIGDSITVFGRNPDSGALTLKQNIGSASIASLNGVFRMTFSPDGNFAYTASYDSDSVTVLRRNPLDGTLSHVASYNDGGSDSIGQTIDGLDAASAVATDPNGQYLFVTGFLDDSVSVFETDLKTGLLIYVETIKRDGSGQPPLDGSRDVLVAPNGRHVYASGYNDDRVVFLPFANPTPVAQSVSPASTIAGSGDTTISIFGQNFSKGSVVRWNGSLSLATTFISSSELQAVIPAAELSAAASRGLQVITPPPGGGGSSSLTFTIGAAATPTTPADNPVPAIEQIAPQGAEAGGPAIQLHVIGSGFLTTSKVYWNGSERPTTYISSSELQASIPASDVAQPGASAVTVVTPAPGGGTSSAAAFTVAAPGENPPPTVIQISPNISALGKSGSLITIMIYGAGFVQGSEGYWQGIPKPTTFISENELKVEITAADILEVGQYSLVIVNPSPGGGPSAAAAFSVFANNESPWKLQLPLVVK
jgi:CSLREA domain-containing protein